MMKGPFVSFGVLLLASQAVGAAAPRAAARPVARSVTFTKDIAPILYEACARCHQPDGPAPFSLITYDEVRRHAAQIASVTARRYMPPWKPEQGVGVFAGERRLSDAQIETIASWAGGDRLEGERSDIPPRRARAPGGSWARPISW